MADDTTGFIEGVPSDVDPGDETTLGLYRLLAQARDGTTPPLSRITAAIAARTFLESLTRRLVNDAREEGASWEEIAAVFGTSPMNIKARFGDYNRYEDE
ncbi:MAG: hypothetical protein M3314_06030 [Actinomycetota bacterium]|jgi:hypothetical protein|nr:hypothetical protein [Actinomycetota bacterium]